MSSVKKNIVYQTAYQLLNTALPLITAPYLSRVLGASNLGIFSYTSSMVSYFTLFAMLGTMNYGTRSIAATQDNKDQRSRVFYEIYALQLSVSGIVFVLYLAYLLLFCSRYKLIACIQIIEIFSCALNIGWLFFGLEKFKVTVTRNMIIKVATVAMILLFVKDAGDLWKYVVIMLTGTAVSQLYLWFYVTKCVNLTKVTIKGVLRHLKPNIALFMPLLAMSVYHTMDKTMLGIMSSAEESGFYYNADRLINIPTNIISGVGTVMLPRITAMINSNREQEGKRLFATSLDGMVMISIAMAFGIAAISEEFVPVFFGDGYTPCIMLCKVMAPILIIKGFSLTVRTQYMIPFKMEKEYTKSVVVGAIVNVIANAILIPYLGATGAALGTLLAELSACIFLFIPVTKQINISKIFCNSFAYILFGLVMYALVRTVVSRFQVESILKIACEITAGGLTYILLCMVFWKWSKNDLFTSVLKSIK